jgi:hypothetical protein
MTGDEASQNRRQSSENGHVLSSHWRILSRHRSALQFRRAMTSKRPKVEPIRNPTLFEMGKLEQAGNLVNSLKVERPYGVTGLLLGTSSFTADGWQGSFYQPGMQTRDFQSYYATQFKTVEIDSTYYGTPSASTITNWYQHTPGTRGRDRRNKRTGNASIRPRDRKFTTGVLYERFTSE